MRIVILGSGALGGVMGAFLARAGHTVTVLARRERLAELEGKPIQVSGVSEFEAAVGWASAETAPDGDVLVVSVKTFQTAAALAPLTTQRYGAVLSVQNGVAKNEVLLDRFPDNTIGCATLIGATLAGPTHVRHVLDGQTWIGELDGRPSDRVREIATAFSAAGLATEAHPNIQSVEWSKLCQYVGASLTGASSRSPLHRVYLSDDLARLYLAALREVEQVARAVGVQVNDFPGFPVATLSQLEFDAALHETHLRGESLRERGLVGIRSSMLEALERGRQTELEDTAGWLVATARRAGVSVPTVETLYRLLRDFHWSPEPAGS